MPTPRRKRKPSAYYSNRKLQQSKTNSQGLCICADLFCQGGYDCNYLQFVTTYEFVHGRRMS